MAIPQTDKTHTADGLTSRFDFEFEYVNTTDIKVSLNDIETTEYTLIDSDTIELNSTPALGVVVRIFRSSNLLSLPHTFFPGSSIRAQDLNEDFEQILFVAQETQRDSDVATDAKSIAATANATAEAAEATANTAANDATNAVNGAATANTNASNAETNAGEALTKANEAISAANAATAAVTQATLPTAVADVNNIPSSPSHNDLIKVIDSTNIQSFPSPLNPLSGLPAGFTGEPGIAVTIIYQDPNNNPSSATWQYLGYEPSDPDDRYTTTAEATTIANAAADGKDTAIANADSKAEDAEILAGNALPKSGGTMGGLIFFDSNQTFDTTGIDTANGTDKGVVTLLNSVTSSSDANGGVAATPGSVKLAYDRASNAINTASGVANKFDQLGNLEVNGGKITRNLANLTAVVNNAAGGNADFIRLNDNLQGFSYYEDNAEILRLGTSTNNHPQFIMGPGVGIGTKTPQSRLDVNGTCKATTFSGSGASITDLNAGNLTTGTVNAARIPSILKTSSSALAEGAELTVEVESTEKTKSHALLGIRRGPVSRTVSGSSVITNLDRPTGFIRLGEGLGSVDKNIFIGTDGKLMIAGAATGIGGNSSNGAGSVVGDQTSDIRLKTLLDTPVPGLSKIKELNPIRFTYNNASGERLGFSAQDVQPILPESVYDTNDPIPGEADDAPTMLAMRYTEMIPVLVNAVKELSTQVETLTARVAALET